jgi:hypothetical protein
VSTSFDSWRLSVVELIRLKTTLSKLVKRMRLFGLSPSFDRWCTNVKVFRRQRRVVERILARISMQNKAVPFASWHVSLTFLLPCNFVLVSVSEICTAKQLNAAEGRYVAQKMLRITRRWVYAAIAILFHSWTDATHERQRLACASSTVVQRWHNHNRSKPFKSWREKCTLSKVVRCLFLKAVLRWNVLAVSVSYERMFVCARSLMCARA